MSAIKQTLGRSVETAAPFATSGFFRRARTLRVTWAYFYLESNCMECLFKKAVNVNTDLQKSTNDGNVVSVT